MKRVLLLTSHYLESKAKAGFHWLADAFWRAGWDVTFCTTSLSWFSWLRGDARFQYPLRQEANRLRPIMERLTSYVWLTPWHPVNFHLASLNRLSRSWFARYGALPLPGLESTIAGADLLLFDSTHSLLLFDRCKLMNPRGRFVYRVSDNMALMNNHPVLLETEQRVAPGFDLISVPSPALHQRFAYLPHVFLHKHALRKDLFDQAHANPFRGPGPHVLFVGRAFFDHDFLRRAVALFPEWTFHVIGPIPPLASAPNLIAYGERPFLETVPFLRHADIGLQNLCYQPGAECFTDSLKMQQYTYCRLPIVAPPFLKTDRPHVFYYQAGDDASIRQALVDASRFDRALVPIQDVWTWDDLISRLAGASPAAAA